MGGTFHHYGETRNYGPLYRETVRRVKDKFVFNGKLTALKPGHEAWTWPLRWPGAQDPLLGAGQPSLVFVSSMSELFHERRSKSIIDRICGTMAASEHIGLLLTKRPQRMAEYLATVPLSALPRWRSHLWLGFSAERQQEFDQRWPYMRLLAEAGWTVFCSIAPMLGPVTLPADFLVLGQRAWVICSGEQGRQLERCRDMNPQWACDVLGQCAEASLPFFMKQMSGRQPIRPDLFVHQFPVMASAV
jgi:protein gp37